MKRTLSIISVFVIIMMLFGCAQKPQTNDEGSAYADAKTVLETVWNGFGDADKFPVGGGDSENIVADAPGKFDVTKTEEMDVTLALPASLHESVEDAASMMHMMNANMFTGAAYKIKDGTDVQSFANTYKDGLNTKQWMCGFPEKYVVVQSGDYVVTAFGNSQNIDTFKAKATELLANATVVSEGNVAV